MLDEREAVDVTLYEAKYQCSVRQKMELLTRPGNSPHNPAGESPDC
jgi:hypothetical protein